MDLAKRMIRLVRKVINYRKENGLAQTFIKIKEKLQDKITGSGAMPFTGKYAAFIRGSAFFDADFYIRNNIDLQYDNFDPATHYLEHGGSDLRDPSAGFCSEEYYYLNEDVRRAKMNPLLHYEMHGKTEGRSIYEFEEKGVVFPKNAVALSREYGIAPVLHRRTAILSCFVADGKIPETLLYLIRGLREIADDIVLIGDCPLLPEELEKLEGLVTYAEFSRHCQYDFGSYKRGLEYARRKGLLGPERTDELIFVNDSCYGPVYPFSESFRTMAGKKVDFWGISKYRSGSSSHISSYFYVFKRKVIDSKLLDLFLERIEGTYDRSRVIATLEVEMTSYLEQNGMRWDVLVKDGVISLFDHPVSFLKEYRVPIVKKKAFTRKGREDQLEALAIIRQNAPELAAMIHYRPLVPAEHHFPTIEEKTAHEKEICRNIREKVKKGEKIRSVFLVFNASFFPSRPLYQKMLEDDLFDPYIALIPDYRWGTGSMYEGLETCFNKLTGSGIPVSRIIRTEADELGRWSDIYDDVDIVCYNSPYNLSSYRYLPRYALEKDFLTVMVNYGFYRSKYDDKILS